MIFAHVALQAAIYQHLRADASLNLLVGDAIFDAMPVDAPSGVFVSLGAEEVRDASDATARGFRPGLSAFPLSWKSSPNRAAVKVKSKVP